MNACGLLQLQHVLPKKGGAQILEHIFVLVTKNVFRRM